MGATATQETASFTVWIRTESLCRASFVALHAHIIIVIIISSIIICSSINHNNNDNNKENFSDESPIFTGIRAWKEWPIPTPLQTAFKSTRSNSKT
mmetsp:Transcript_41761/g.69757  ORF Transcript_41761/g.69757 Transcript_41761/m.69757 type:complete len:96 (-) Transcript_41761:605-892(-)